MRKCSASQGGVSITRENVYAETPTKTWGNPNAARMQRLDHPCVAAVNVECETVWWFPININTQLQTHTAIVLLGHFPRGTKIYIHTKTLARIFTSTYS